MKLYRVQARYIGVYLNHNIEAESEEQVIDNFINELNAGKVKIQEEKTGRITRLCLATYEEIERDRIISVTSSQKDGLGVKVEPVISGTRQSD
jgi:hypothetical protein